MENERIYLVLIGLVVLFGIAVLVVSRMRAKRSESLPPAPPRIPPTAPPQRPGTAVLEPEVLEPEVVEPEVGPEPEVVEPVTLRSRMARARAAFTGAFTGIRGRQGITSETWDDLEEGLLLADVGVGVTTGLLDDLRRQVKAKEIAEPQQLLDALRAEMKARLAGADRVLHFDAAVHPNIWLFV